jgi:hypothetical protein
VSLLKGDHLQAFAIFVVVGWPIKHLAFVSDFCARDVRRIACMHNHVTYGSQKFMGALQKQLIRMNGFVLRKRA